MRKLKLTELNIKSFATSRMKALKGGSGLGACYSMGDCSQEPQLCNNTTSQTNWMECTTEDLPQVCGSADTGGPVSFHPQEDS